MIAGKLEQVRREVRKRDAIPAFCQPGGRPTRAAAYVEDAAARRKVGLQEVGVDRELDETLSAVKTFPFALIESAVVGADIVETHDDSVADGSSVREDEE